MFGSDRSLLVRHIAPLLFCSVFLSDMKELPILKFSLLIFQNSRTLL